MEEFLNCRHLAKGVSGTSVAFESEQVFAFMLNSNPRKYHLSRWNEDNPNQMQHVPVCMEVITMMNIISISLITSYLMPITSVLRPSAWDIWFRRMR